MKRESKQFLYGLFFLFILSAVIWFVSFSSGTPTCFDGRQNQGETGVDCGGPCTSCDLKTLSSLKVNFIDSLEFNNTFVFLSEISNPNQNYNARLNYKISFLNDSGKVIDEKYSTIFISSSDDVYIYEVLDSNYSETDISLLNVEWLKVEDSFSYKPEITESSVSLIDGEIVVDGTVINESNDSFREISVLAIFKDSLGFNNLLVGEDVITSLDSFDEKDFKILIPVSDELSEKINLEETQLIININDF